MKKFTFNSLTMTSYDQASNMAALYTKPTLLDCSRIKVM